MAFRYVAGNDIRFFRDQSQFQFETGRHGGDILVRLIPYRERRIPNPHDITGQFWIPDANPIYEEYEGFHYTSAPYYDVVDKLTKEAEDANAYMASKNGEYTYGTMSRVQTIVYQVRASLFFFECH